MPFNNKIVKYTTTDAEPFVISGKKKSSGPEKNSGGEVSETEEPGIDEETLQRMLEEIAAKEQRAIDKLKEAEVKAGIMRQEIQNECDELMNQANKEAETIRKQAREEGHAEGLQQGRADGEKAVRKELEQTIRQANAKAEKTLADAKELTADYFVRAENNIVEIVMMAIEKILPQHFLDVPQVVLPVVREAIKYVRDQKEITIHVEPDSYDLILMARSEFQSMLTDGTAVLEVVSDDSLKKGDCVIETPNGGVDARLMTQIELMKEAVENVLNK